MTLGMLADERAERAVLVVALLDAEGAERVIPRLAGIVKPADFHDPRHATLWEAFLSIHTRAEPVDVLTVEYAADGVIVVARKADDPRVRVLVVAKNRHGDVGRAELRWSGTAYYDREEV